MNVSRDAHIAEEDDMLNILTLEDVEETLTTYFFASHITKRPFFSSWHSETIVHSCAHIF